MLIRASKSLVVNETETPGSLSNLLMEISKIEVQGHKPFRHIK